MKKSKKYLIIFIVFIVLTVVGFGIGIPMAHNHYDEYEQNRIAKVEQRKAEEAQKEAARKKSVEENTREYTATVIQQAEATIFTTYSYIVRIGEDKYYLNFNSSDLKRYLDLKVEDTITIIEEPSIEGYYDNLDGFDHFVQVSDNKYKVSITR